MSRRPIPKLVRLDPSGHHVTPDVEGFEMAIGYPPEEGLPMRFRFVLSDGVALDLPVSPEIACEIRDKLTKAFPPDDVEAREANQES